MMKLLLVNVVDWSRYLQASHTSLGLAYIASYLRKHFPNAVIRIADKNVNATYREFRPDIVGFSSVTENFSYAIKLAQQLKFEQNVPTIVGGVHISMLPHTLPQCFDVGVIGEGEKTMLGLMQLFGDSGFRKEDLRQVKGIAFHDGREVVITPSREPICSLDDIPFPARDLLQEDSQIMITSRGCPFRCPFCSSSRFWQGVRFFTAEYVVNEMKEILRNYPDTSHITIYDDLFIANRQRLEEIVNLVQKEGLQKKLRFWCNGRANLMTPEVARALREMNMMGVSLGLESGSDRVLASIKDGPATVEINEKAIEVCKIHGLEVHGSFMLGSPGENMEDMEKTREFIRRSLLDRGDIAITVPFPGTAFWDYAKREKLVDENMDWNKLSIWHTHNLPKNADDFILLSSEVTKNDFLKIFLDISRELLRREEVFKRRLLKERILEIGRDDILSFENMKKAAANPGRAAQYFVSLAKERLFKRQRK